mmetsp:Transcript_10033/g.21943  ORF Transcript_10033/g.21943 Transcript_10033/m.21943 type:complete len:991 (+) Transcript_10033:36-3008(+)
MNRSVGAVSSLEEQEVASSLTTIQNHPTKNPTTTTTMMATATSTTNRHKQHNQHQHAVDNHSSSVEQEGRDEPDHDDDETSSGGAARQESSVELCLGEQQHNHSNHSPNSPNDNDDDDDDVDNNGTILIPSRSFPDGDAMSLTSELTGNCDDFYEDEDEDEEEDNQDRKQKRIAAPPDDDDAEAKIPDFHKLLQKGDWDGCAQALVQLEKGIGQVDSNNNNHDDNGNGAFLFHRAILKLNQHQETLLHALCYKAPTWLAQQFLTALPRHCEDDAAAIRQVLTLRTRDADQNTALHLAAAHVAVGGPAAWQLLTLKKSKKKKDKKTKSSSKKKKSSSSSGGGKGGSKRGKSLRKSGSRRMMSSTTTSTEDNETVTESTAELSADGNSNKEQQQQPQRNSIASTDVSSSPVLDLTVLKQLVLLAPELLSMTNNNGDTPLHLLVSSQGFCGVLVQNKKRGGSSSSKKKKSSSKSSSSSSTAALLLQSDAMSETARLEAEMAAEDALKSLLDVTPHEIAMKVNNLGRTLLHCAIAQGAFERVLVQIMARLPFCASVQDARGLYPLHYVAAFMGSCNIPWTFAQDLIAAYPAALLAQTDREGDTPLQSLIYTVQQRKHDHDEKQRKKQLKSKRSITVKEFYMDRNTAKLAEMLLKPTAPPRTERRSIGVAAGSNAVKDRGNNPMTKSCPDMDHILNLTNSSSSSLGSDEQRQDKSRKPRGVRRQKSVRFNKPGSSETAEDDGEVSALMMFNHDSLSPLHCCAIADTPQGLVKILLEKSGEMAQRACALRTPPLDQPTHGGATPNYGATPLHLALARTETTDLKTTMEALLQKGSNALTVQDSHGLTPLAVALLNPDITSTLLKSLIKSSSMSIGIPTNDHHWPLHLAFEHSATHVEDTVCRALIQATSSKSFPSMLTADGNTPLHLACAKPGISKKVVKLLLDKHEGARFLRNKKGLLPHDLACKHNPKLNKEVPQLDVPFVVKEDPSLEAMYLG